MVMGEYQITNLYTGRSYRVRAGHEVSLDHIWRSQKMLFAQGALVKITGPLGKGRIFMKGEQYGKANHD